MSLPQDPLKWAVNAFRDGRNEQYDVYESYFAGKQPLVFASKKFESAFGTVMRSFAYNRCGMVVDAHADRMKVSGFGADKKNEGLATRAHELWEENHMDVREGHVYADQFTAGDAYVIAEMHPTLGKVQYWVQSPKSVRVHWDGEAPDQLDLGAKLWMDEGYCRLNLYFKDRIEKYISINKTPSGVPSGPGHFQRYDLDSAPFSFTLNVTDKVPIFHFANNARTNQYGVSELRSVIALQDAVNKTLMDMLVAMEFAAFPQRVLMGVDARDDDEMMALVKRFESGMDRIWAMEASDGKIGEFSAVNIAQYIAVAEYWDKAISRVSKVPVHYLGMSSSFASGRAYRIAESPFTAKIEDRQNADGATWDDLSVYGLRLDGLNAQPGDIRTNWKSAAPSSEEDELDLGLQKSALGFPFEAILREGGYDPDQIETIMAEKEKAVDRAQAAFSRGTVSTGFDKSGQDDESDDEQDAA